MQKTGDQQQIILALLDVQVTNPWSLETVSSFMSSKYYAEKAVLSEAALSSYLYKRMNRQQLCTAMQLALEHRRKEWALLIRFALAWMSSSARRASDMRLLFFRAMCTDDTLQSNRDGPLGTQPAS